MKQDSMKSKRIAFYTIIIISFVIVGMYILYYFNIIPHKKYCNADFNIHQYVSHSDRDADGIDDQNDILEGVLHYISTNPKYKSKYYETGYPDDGYGVCTDVVAFGLRSAGYDLQKLLNEDILKHRELYNIEEIDNNIDFRRVQNLNVYFARNVISLTTDVSDIEQWHGGDIVVFKKHIGILSDSRNKNGVPFVIHHASPYQMSYEEDILESRNDIIGHYRIS
ncbi:DUF1287 domain-containing protein [Anaerotignum sp.]|uniref:DUF1287 domain-containing protein n=1 Tax=Anaerotignum sp. TaxID=2039241 RepID=UPI0028B08B50|nr:DUF1287 domain-containing protein [Anaerotignum sp.]